MKIKYNAKSVIFERYYNSIVILSLKFLTHSLKYLKFDLLRSMDEQLKEQLGNCFHNSHVF